MPECSSIVLLLAVLLSAALCLLIAFKKMLGSLKWFNQKKCYSLLKNLEIDYFYYYENVIGSF